jgi:hypothetical protein
MQLISTAINGTVIIIPSQKCSSRLYLETSPRFWLLIPVKGSKSITMTAMHGKETTNVE